MVVGHPPPIAVAAGAGQDILGTDAVRIAEAVAAVASDRGVLVLMDLGSALLSSELALELLDDSSTPVRLSSAPFVEGLLAAVVLAASGATLDDVDRGAVAALDAKSSQLAAPAPPDRYGVSATTADAVSDSPDATAEVRLVNRDGLHARPAAAVVAAVAAFDAHVSLTNLRTGVGPVPASTPIGLAALAARVSDTIRVEAIGSDAQAAVDAVRDLVAAGFGDLRPAETAATAATAFQGGGVGVSPGRVVGRAVVLPPPAVAPDQQGEVPRAARPAEADRAAAAAAAVAADIRDLAAALPPVARDILSAVAAMAQDPQLLGAIRAGVVDQGLTAERAVWQAVAEVCARFTSAGPLLAARAVDVEAVRDRIIARLTARPAPGSLGESAAFVLVAHDLAATETALLDPHRCLAIVTLGGTPGSHTAVLARCLGIPTVVVAACATTISDGAMVLVDGSTGEVIVDPSEGQRANVRSSLG